MKRKTITVSNGYNGHTVDLSTDILSTDIMQDDSNLVKLHESTPGREYLTRWVRKSDYLQLCYNNRIELDKTDLNEVNRLRRIMELEPQTMEELIEICINEADRCDSWSIRDGLRGYTAAMSEEIERLSFQL